MRQIVASVGRAGRALACGYVGGGGSLAQLSGHTLLEPGFALTVGIEFPGGPRGAVQIDAQLHLINAGSRYPIGSSTVVDGRLTAGWVYRF
jgi:hypothetical protein